jgi:hypothetical protein
VREFANGRRTDWGAVIEVLRQRGLRPASTKLRPQASRRPLQRDIHLSTDWLVALAVEVELGPLSVAENGCRLSWTHDDDSKQRIKGPRFSLPNASSPAWTAVEHGSQSNAGAIAQKRDEMSGCQAAAECFYRIHELEPVRR